MTLAILAGCCALLAFSAVVSAALALRYHRQLGASLRGERAAWHRLIQLRRELETTQEVLVTVLNDRADMQDRVMTLEGQLRSMNIRAFAGGPSGRPN